jgi:phytoene dehydrogenase-like protein
MPWAMHLDFGPDVSGGAAFPFLEPPIYQSFGMPLSQGGVGALIGAMAAVVKKNGGEIVTGAKVAKVLIKNGQAVGVQTVGGQKIYTRKSVIANVTPTQLAGGLIDAKELPSDYVRRSRKFRYGPGTMMIHLALDGAVPWAAGEEFGKFNYVHAAPYINDLARTYTAAMNGVLPASPLLVAGQLSVTDPTRAPKGKNVLWVQVRMLPARPAGDEMTGSEAIAPGDWSRIKERYADRVLKKLEQYAPGLSQKILKRYVLSPADLQRDDPNLVGGDSLAGSHHLDQFYMFRPIPGWSRYATPIKGLFMVGASTWPGAGLSGTWG